MPTTISGSTGVTFPAGGVGNTAGAAVGTTDTQTLTNKTLTTPNIDSAQVETVSGTAPLYMARAWVNFNGTGTVAIRASGNVSSITDSGSGQYAVNFTTAMPDVNYVSVFSSNANADAYGGTRQFSMIRTRATGSIQVNTVDEGGAQSDPSYVGGAIFR
jgi:hypothetical protein